MTDSIPDEVIDDPDFEPTILNTIANCLLRIQESEAFQGTLGTEADPLWAAVAALQIDVEALKTRVSTLEANYTTDHASLVSITAHLALVNALLHLW